MKKVWLAALGIAALVVAALPLPSAAQGGIKLGVLKCRSLPNTRVRIFLRSAVRVKCTFTASRLAGKEAGKSENYEGEFGLLGIDLSTKTEQKMEFLVFGLSKDITIGSHTLAGDYNGVLATIGFGIGGGPNHLIGGFGDSFSLAPSIETHKGIGVTVGGTRLSLKPAE